MAHLLFAKTPLSFLNGAMDLFENGKIRGILEKIQIMSEFY
ncbi:hypothetical protein [Rickettsiales endosymbiont of Stachyamoeba lipophora]|nr:hypothetical protein [Rickettsiales endosymbiont of Stachyamoeba lipophora]